MKKFIALMFALVMGLSVLTGCGDPVADDFEQFWNSEDMGKIGQNLTELSRELDQWDEDQSINTMKKSLKDAVLPKIDESMDLLANTTAETEEVKAIKNNYGEMLESCEGAFEMMLEGLEKEDEKIINKAAKKVDECTKLMLDCDKEAQALAKEKGFEFEE